MTAHETLTDLIVSRKEETLRGITFILDESEDRFVSYSDLYYTALGHLYHLQAAGFKPGDEVIFQIEDNNNFVFFFWACVLGGMIPVPVTAGANDEHKLKLFKIWEVLNNPRIITSREFIDKLDSFAAKSSMSELVDDIRKSTVYVEEVAGTGNYGEIYKPKPEDIAFIQFSSGSTGDPKGVIITHQNVLTNLNAVIKWTNIGPNDAGLNWMPLTHDMGLIGTHIKALLAGINQYSMQTQLFIRRPTLWIEKASKYKVTILYSPNFGYKHFLKFVQPDTIRGWDLSNVRLIFNGAEPISSELCNEFLSRMEQYKLKRNAMYPVFGLAEGTIAVTFPHPGEDFSIYRLDRDFLGIGEVIKEVSADSKNAVTFVDVGYPIYNCYMRICDEKNNDLGENKVGYIQIKGGNVTSGYYNNKGATEQTITSDGWLNTGDLGFMRNGRLVITGRAKDIIFMAGQNYYSHDIERVAEAVEGIELGKVAAVGAFNENKKCDELILFVLYKPKSVDKFLPIVSSLKRIINQQMGIEVSEVIPVRSIPKTTSGKTQRYKLRESYINGEFSEVKNEIHSLLDENFISREIDLPQNEIEEKLLGLWCDVLGASKVGTRDNFFELGGDSLKATQLISRIRDEFNTQLDQMELFENADIVSLAVALGKADRKGVQIQPIIEKAAAASDRLPLSFSQQRLWFLDRLNGQSAQYNLYTALQLKGSLNIELLLKSFNEVMKRHEVLRASFIEDDGQPVQVIHPGMTIDIPLVDMTDIAEEERKKRVLELAKEEASQPFTLEKAPLICGTLYRIKEEEYILVLVAHHIIFDGWSFGVLLKELAFYYEALSSNKGEVLPELEIQYADFAHWQVERIKGGLLKEQLDYWKGQLGGKLTVLDLPLDKQRPAIQTYNGAKLTGIIPRAQVEELQRLARKEGVTLFMVLLSAFKALLHRYTGQEDVIVGSPIANRNRREVEGLIGFFTNNVVLRTGFSGGASFQELLNQVKKVTLEAYANQDVPFEKLVEELNVERDMSRNPLFQVLFSLQNTPTPVSEFAGISISSTDLDIGCARFDLALDLWETKEGLAATFEYNTDLFHYDTISRIAGHYTEILEEIALSPEKEIKRLDILTGAERKTLLEDWNNTEADFGDVFSWVELFESQVEKAPDAVAVVAGNNQLTYKELNSRANQLAHYLTSIGVDTETIVGVYVERSVEMVVGLLGIHKAGAAYLPMDPIFPKDRLAYMVEDANVPVILTDRGIAGTLPEHNARLVYLDDKQEFEGLSDINPEKKGNSKDLAYVIYTSGSTGKPKGVQIEQFALINFLKSMERDTGVGEKDSLLAVTTLSFDIAGLELFMPLIAGAKVVLASRDEAMDGELLIEKIKEYNVTIMQATPATWRLLIESGWAGTPELTVLCGGEALPRDLANSLLDRCGCLWNVYGPTETTIWSTMARVESKTGAISIGKPIANTQIYVLDTCMNPVPVGIPGELFIGGDGVARGYLNRPELTQEKFIPDPFLQKEGARLYRTGDLVKFTPDGSLEFVGRIDHQVKIRGFRIELGEIETILTDNPAVHQSVVVAREIIAGEMSLVAYIIPESGHDSGALTAEKLRAYLKGKLPDYMVPSAFVTLEAFPMTPNGKIDRKALPMPEALRPKLEANYMAPENEIEKSLTAIWQEVLKLSRVGVNDSFFDLGGHSLLLAQVRSKIMKVLKKDVSIMDLFKYPTINTLAKFLQHDGKLEVQGTADSARTIKNRSESSDIAVIGLSGRFPGAKNVEEFWQNLCSGVNSITRLSDEEIIAEGVDPELLKNPEYVKAWGALDGVDKFDAKFFGYNPREAEILDPQQRIFLEEAWKALENSGYDSEKFGKAVGVFASVGMNAYVQNLSGGDKDGLASSYQIMISNDKDFLATRVAYKMNLEGPAITVQTACSSSLVAVHLACQSLLNGECNIAIAGGVSVRLPQKTGYLYQEGMILSPDGHCRAFDASSKGTVGGNGAGVVVLKRLEDAIADGDEISAVIKGTGINNDGSLKVGYTAPRIDGQAGAISEAMAKADINPETITYIEAHGTGTPLGDPIEIEALKQVFTRKTDKKGFCAVGSVKTNVGHLDAAAGITGLIKTVLSLKNKMIPPSLNYEKPNPKIDFENSPFFVNTKLTEWRSSAGPLRAGLSSFGIGGTNAHAVLEEAPALNKEDTGKESCLMIFSAKTETALDAMTANFVDFLKKNVNVNMADVAYTLQMGRKEFEYRRYLVCTSREDAIEALESINAEPKRVFSGMVEQAAGMQVDENSLKTISPEELGKLWLSGTRIDWSKLYEGQQRRRVALPSYPFEGQSFWVSKRKEKVVEKDEAAKRQDVSEWFYSPVWKQSTQDVCFTPDLVESGPVVLVLAKAGDFTGKLVRRMAEFNIDVITATGGSEYKKADNNTYIFNPDNNEDYDKLIQELAGMGKKPGKVVSLLGVGDNNADTDRQFYSLLYLTQALGKQAWNTPIHIKVLTNNSYRIFGETALAPEKALIQGPIRVIPREYPNIKCNGIDFTIPEPGSEIETEIVDQLIAEIYTETEEPAIAYRGVERWIQDFEKVKLESKNAPAVPLKNGGVYLITGGMGGIGLVLAGYLAKGNQVKLALVSRSGLPEREQWDELLVSRSANRKTLQIIKKLKSFEELGAQILICKGDVTNPEDMIKVRDQVEQSFGKVDGIIHAAGVPGGGMIQLKKKEASQDVLAPKVKGTIALHEAFKDSKLDFFILCSSLNAITGGFGQIDYSSANAFLDAFAQKYDSRRGTRCVSINWDRWPGVGMAVEPGRQGEAQEEVHPLLGKRVTDTPEKMVYLSELNPEKDWALSEHLVLGVPTIAGTTYLEMARAAMADIAGSAPVEITDVLFLTPLAVKNGEKRDVFTILDKDGEGYRFRIVSRLRTEGEGKSGWQEHSRGKVAVSKVEPGKEFDLLQLAATCNERVIDMSRPEDKPKEEFISFGGRWRSLKKFGMRGSEALVEVELGSEFASDLAEYKLHPSTLDVATGSVRLANGGNYLPFSYARLIIKGYLTQKVYAHIRYKNGYNSDVITVDIDIIGDNGSHLAEIKDFSMRLVSEAAAADIKVRTSGEQGQAEFAGLDKLYADATGKKGISALSEGIAPDEGMEAFKRILQGCFKPQVVVSTKDIKVAVQQAQYINQPGIGGSLDDGDQNKTLHPRPDLKSEYVAPKNEAERKISDIWQRLLGIDKVGIHDEFFELGGDSLLLVQMHSKLKENFETEIAAVDLYKYNTVAALAKYLSSDTEEKQPVFEDVNKRANRQIEMMKQRKQQMMQRRGVIKK
ncbi:MAG: amino acid adenylation domain-containing protein [Clostridia bacterium]|nr:amino acid adenylation domain-containing protein [Clostridia bacterium]